MQLAVCVSVCDNTLTLYNQSHLWSCLNQHFLNHPLLRCLKSTVFFQHENYTGLKINMFIFVLEVVKRNEYHQHRWSGGGGLCWHVQVFHPMHTAFNGAHHSVCVQTQSRPEMCRIGPMRTHWHLSLGKAPCGFPRLPSCCRANRATYI